jgi:DNA-binding IclR family transcriptional regulator
MSDTNSFERMLAVLSLFTEDRLEWTTEALMKRLGYSRPTIYRYLKTLKDHGFLVGRPNVGFTLGPKVVEMDFLLRRSDPLVLEGRESLVRLVARYPCTAFLARWYGDKVLCVLSEQSANADLTSSYPRGRPMPIARGATARAILAFLPRRQLIPLVESRLSDFQAIGLGNDVAAVAERLGEVRRTGVAIARAEVTPGVVGVAAPVFDDGTAPIASLTLTIREERALPVLASIQRDVSTAAAALSLSLGERRTELPRPLSAAALIGRPHHSAGDAE